MITLSGRSHFINLQQFQHGYLIRTVWWWFFVLGTPLVEEIVSFFDSTQRTTITTKIVWYNKGSKLIFEGTSDARHSRIACSWDNHLQDSWSVIKSIIDLINSDEMIISTLLAKISSYFHILVNVVVRRISRSHSTSTGSEVDSTEFHDATLNAGIFLPGTWMILKCHAKFHCFILKILVWKISSSDWSLKVSAKGLWWVGHLRGTSMSHPRVINLESSMVHAIAGASS